jgi:hypothetical protein
MWRGGEGSGGVGTASGLGDMGGNSARRERQLRSTTRQAAGRAGCGLAGTGSDVPVGTLHREPAPTERTAPLASLLTTAAAGAPACASAGSIGSGSTSGGSGEVDAVWSKSKASSASFYVERPSARRRRTVKRGVLGDGDERRLVVLKRQEVSE